MRVGLVAGEASGDMLGAGLIAALKARSPGIRFEGVAGPAMQAAGCDVWESSDALAVMGLIEPLREVPRLLRLRKSLVRRWTENPPDVFVGIDAPDFNLGLEKKLRSVGITTIQYVSPSVWAWRPWRVRKIARAADKVLCLLPFEKAFYDEHVVAAEFVGHPLADKAPANLQSADARRELGLEARQAVAVLPGSRMGEVMRLGPIFAATCARLAKTDPQLRFVAAMASDQLKKIFAEQIAQAGVEERFVLVAGNAELVISASDVVLLASGTASLQAALLQRPMVAAYRLAPVTYAIVKAFSLIKVAHFTLPNLLTAEPLVPEFLQGKATPAALSSAIRGLLDDTDRCVSIQTAFALLRDQLALGADARAAAAVLDMAGR